jgi:hypothetical protein
MSRSCMQRREQGRGEGGGHLCPSLFSTLHISLISGRVDDVKQLGEGEEMSSVRAYLGLVRHLDLTIHNPMTTFLENQLVEARKKDKNLAPHTMHSWLTVPHPHLSPPTPQRSLEFAVRSPAPPVQILAH